MGTIIIIIISVWMGVIPFTLTEAKAQEPVVIQVDWAEPCYAAPCSKTCQHGATKDESLFCVNLKCRHQEKIFDSCWTGRCGKCSGVNADVDKDIELILSCNGFKRKVLECKMPEYKS